MTLNRQKGWLNFVNRTDKIETTELHLNINLASKMTAELSFETNIEFSGTNCMI